MSTVMTAYVDTQYPENELDELKSHSSIPDLVGTHTRLKRDGRKYLGRCIAAGHLDAHPSMSVFQSSDGVWLAHCFPCGYSYNIFQFLDAFKNKSFVEAVEIVREFVGNKKSTPASARKTPSIVYNQAATIARLPEAKTYLESHGIRMDIARERNVGVDDFPVLGESIIFPYNETAAKVRSLQEKKFRHYPATATSDQLYGLNEIKPGEPLIITESERDSLTLISHGFNAISVSSATACLSDGVLKYSPADLNRVRTASIIYLALDQDKEGQACTTAFLKEFPDARVLSWPYGGKDSKDPKDIGDLYLVDPSTFKSRMMALCQNAKVTPVAPVLADVSSPDCIPVYVQSSIDNSYLGQLTRLLTKGTAIPPEFVWNNAAMILGAIVDGKIAFGGHEDLHMRAYAVNVSSHSRTGKGTSWLRTGEGKDNLASLQQLLLDSKIAVIDGSMFGSGEFLVAEIENRAKEIQSENPGGRVDVIARFDEFAEMFEKSKAQGSTLVAKLLTMFERDNISTGSFKNKSHQVRHLHFSLSGDFTSDGFERSFAGQGARGSGLLSRFTCAYAAKITAGSRWAATDDVAVHAVVDKIKQKLEQLTAGEGGQGEIFESPKLPPFILRETDQARLDCEDYFECLEKEDEVYTPELYILFKRNLVLRTFFSDLQVIDEQRVAEAVEWARHQLAVRKALWPEDAGNNTEQFEKKILRVLATGPLPIGALQRRCNVHRPGSGGMDAFMRAIRALLSGNRIRISGKTRTKSDIYCLTEE